ncbi:MAG: AAA family ATPase [Chloroflexota bacterium]|nr:AAA family ATPase [Chloroflexota bacterium]
MFGVALALANSQGGFLLIDEAENGIHHTIQRDFWRMALLTAQANNVQVFATTHSWDCVAGFAQAAVAAEGVEGALVRLDSDGEGIRAVEYSEEDLQVAAEQGIEVR